MWATRAICALLAIGVAEPAPRQEVGPPTSQPAPTAGPPAATISVIDVRSFGAAGDGVADDTDAIEAAIRAAAPRRLFAREAVARPEGARIIYFPTPAAYYRTTRRIDIPSDRNLRLLGDSSHSARISLDNPGESYLFRVLAGDGQRPTIFEKLVFHRGGIEYEGGIRRMQAIRDCAFVGAPDWAVRTLGKSVIAFEISRTQFSEGNGGINIASEQSDLWVISHCDFVRNRGVDLRIATSGVHVRDCDFEVKPEPSNPFVQIVSDADGVRPGNDVVFQNVRFGNEPPSAPRDVVVIGPLSGTAVKTTGAIWFRDCLWRGAYHQVPSPSNGWSAIRLNQPTVAVSVTGSSFWGYRYIIDEAFLASGPPANVMPHQNVFADNTLLFVTPETRLFSWGGVGWSVRGPAARLLDPGRAATPGSGGWGRPVTNLLPSTDHLDDKSAWAVSYAAVDRAGRGPDGARGSAFRLVVSDKGVPQLRASALEPIDDTVATFSVWVRAETRWSVGLALMGQGGVWRTSPRELISIDEEWRRFSVSAFSLEPFEVLTAVVLPSKSSSGQSPEVYLAFPQLERGPSPTAFTPNLEPGQTHAPRSFQGLGLGLLSVGTGLGPPTEGRYAVGDKILNEKPEELGRPGSMYVVDGWRCVESGAPGTWVELRALTGR